MKTNKASFFDGVRAAIAAIEGSRNALCREVDIDPASLCRFMAGKHGLTSEAIERLAERLALEIRQVQPPAAAKPKTPDVAVRRTRTRSGRGTVAEGPRSVRRGKARGKKGGR